MNLYEDIDTYVCHLFRTREEWLTKRINGIGGSDSSTFIGMNPYKTNNQLWKEKKGIIKPKEITSEAIDHGNALEPVLRAWFAATHKDYEVQYQENAILQSKKNEWQLYSPDGLLFHKEQGNGIFESKTTLIQNVNMLEQWNNQIPMHYYIQILHGLLVTEFNYIWLVAELRFAWEENKAEIREYLIKKEDIKSDLDWLMSKEQYNWNEFYVKDKEPPMIIQM